MSYDNNNIFAKILRNELPCHKVYEDEYTLAFMDIMPQADGHTLVIPKEPAEDLLSMSEEGAARVITQVQKISTAVKTAMKADGITIMQLNGSAAGQTVPHIHFHIIPGSILGARSHSTQIGDTEVIAKNSLAIKAALQAANS